MQRSQALSSRSKSRAEAGRLVAFSCALVTTAIAAQPRRSPIAHAAQLDERDQTTQGPAVHNTDTADGMVILCLLTVLSIDLRTGYYMGECGHKG